MCALCPSSWKASSRKPRPRTPQHSALRSAGDCGSRPMARSSCWRKPVPELRQHRHPSCTICTAKALAALGHAPCVIVRAVTPAFPPHCGRPVVKSSAWPCRFHLMPSQRRVQPPSDETWFSLDARMLLVAFCYHSHVTIHALRITTPCTYTCTYTCTSTSTSTDTTSCRRWRGSCLCTHEQVMRTG